MVFWGWDGPAYWMSWVNDSDTKLENHKVLISGQAWKGGKNYLPLLFSFEAWPTDHPFGWNPDFENHHPTTPLAACIFSWLFSLPRDRRWNFSFIVFFFKKNIIFELGMKEKKSLHVPAHHTPKFKSNRETGKVFFESEWDSLHLRRIWKNYKAAPQSREIQTNETSLHVCTYLCHFFFLFGTQDNGIVCWC